MDAGVCQGLAQNLLGNFPILPSASALHYRRFAQVPSNRDKGIFDASRNRAIAQLAVNKPGLPGCRFFHIGMNGDINHEFGIELLGVNSRRQKPCELHRTILCSDIESDQLLFQRIGPAQNARGLQPAICDNRPHDIWIQILDCCLRNHRAVCIARKQRTLQLI